MNEWKLELTQQAIDDPQASIQCLIDASSQIADASEQDLRAMKDTKWYKRLWNIVTFSKENEKRIAHNVANLSKLQEIVMRAIVLLSAQSAETAEIVQQNSDKIDDLCQKVDAGNKAQLSIMRELERIKNGIEKTLSLPELPDSSRTIVVNAVFRVADEIPSEDELCKQYLSAMMRTAHCTAADIQESMNLSCIENLKTKETQLLYQLAMEYVFIATDSFDYSGEITEYISLNSRRMAAIQKQISKMASRAGKEALLNGFDPESNDYAAIDESDIEFEEVFEEESPDGETDAESSVVHELEDLEISSILNIPADETKTFRYKNIVLKSLVHCEGNLVFEHCVITYNSGNYSDEITLEGNARLEARDSTFVAKGFDIRFAITAKDASHVHFEGCAFQDCSFFLDCHRDSGSSASFQNCYLSNCGRLFANMGYDSRSLVIDGLQICTDYLSPRNIDGFIYAESGKKLNDSSLRGIVDEHSLFGMACKECSIRNVSVTETENYRANQKKTYWLSYFVYGYYGGSIKVSDSSFVGTSGSISSDSAPAYITGCNFKNCRCPVSMREGGSVNTCVFEECEDVLFVGANSKVTQCKFIGCKNEIVHCGWSPHGCCEVSFCEFVNCTNNYADKEAIPYGTELACVSLSKGKKDLPSRISDCIFDGIDINQGFLIKAHISEKIKTPAIIVERCDFRNCSTKRESGVLISKYATYDFEAKHNLLAVEVKSDCRGLDRVNKEGSKTTDEQKTKNTAPGGKTVGSVFKGVFSLTAGGLPGLVIDLASEAKEAKDAKENEMAERAAAE